MKLKKVSEVRKYNRLKNLMRLLAFLSVPTTVAMYMLLSTKKELFSGLIFSTFACMFFTAIGFLVLNTKKVRGKTNVLMRYEEKFLRYEPKRTAREVMILFPIINFAFISLYFIKGVFLGEFLPMLLISGFILVFVRPRILCEISTTVDTGGINNSFNGEYEFSPHTSSQPENFLMDPAHPSSLLNPTNPASPTYISRDT